MPGLFSRLKARDGLRKKKNGMKDLANSLPQKPKWDDAYTRASVEPEEVHELLHFCTAELKARGLDIPFLLLPYRPTSDPSAVRTFIRHFHDESYGLKGDALSQDLRMTEPMVIAGVAKWCWSRLPGGVVGWDAYELFKIGEGDSRLARDSFKTFIPLSVESASRQRIIFDFFELISAVAAHGKSNGFGGLHLPRMAAWWAFEQKDTGTGFDGGYKTWIRAADATTHLFFAYLRSLSPEEGLTGITLLPRSLEKLLTETEYPPRTPTTLVSQTKKLVMLVDSVSPTPFALLRRAGHFQYRNSDPALQEFSEYEDPVQALTEECLRVLRAISAANESHVSSIEHSTSLRDASWSRFEDIGFSGTVAEEPHVEDSKVPTQHRQVQGLRGTPASGVDLGRPTTPSWADFLSSGFVDETESPSNLLLPPDKVLPPLETQIRQQSSQSHRPRLESNMADLQPGELASITVLLLDHAFWWVWMNSLAPEETALRKSVFGRCAVIETKVAGGTWLVMEEMIAGAAPQQDEGAYIAEKKRLFSWTRRGKNMTRRKSVGKHGLDRNNGAQNFGDSKANIGPDTQARIQAKAAQMRALQEHEEQANLAAARRGRMDDSATEKTTSVLTLQPLIAGEASSAMKWVKKYDKGTIRDAYMANSNAGRGVAVSFSSMSDNANGTSITNGNGHVTEQKPIVPTKDDIPASPSVAIGEHLSSPLLTSEKREQSQTGPEKIRDMETELAKPGIISKNDDGSVTLRRDTAAASPAEIQSPTASIDDSKQKALESSKDKKGLRNLLRRKNRSSKIPDNATTLLPTMLNKSPSPYTEPAASTEATLATYETTIVNSEPTLDASFADNMGPTSGSLTPVDMQDAAEAKDEFSRFDQGPLADQPAFVPEGEDDDSTPPPIARHAHPKQEEEIVSPKAETVEKLNQSASPGVQDRWAQIRKNAAQRAATRQRDEPGRGNKNSGSDDDTSAEETIESRVARIKARVAELTGNIETGPGSHQNQQPVTGRS